MNIATENIAVILASGELVIVYAEQEIPSGAIPYIPAPKVETIDDIRTEKIIYLSDKHMTERVQSVALTTLGGVTAMFQADSGSVENITGALAGYSAETLPVGFYWVAEDNSRVPFTYADIKGLASIITAQGWQAFQKYQDKKAELAGVKTIAKARAVTW
jgi:hypothetical protein